MSGASVVRSSLVNFFIYNTDYGQREGSEEEKIMLYTPDDIPLGKQINAVGLCQAIAQFVNTFNPSHSCEFLVTQKTKQYFINPEGNFWMVITLSIPCTEKVSKEKKVLEYYADDIQDNLGKAVLTQAYDMFVLFNGKFDFIVDTYGVEALKERFKFFYTRYLVTLNFGQMDILDLYQGILYLPLDKVDFLRVQCFVNLVENTFTGIKHVCFLHTEQLVWTTLERDDIKILFRYLTSSLFPASAATNDADDGIVRSSPVANVRNSPLSAYGNSFPNPGKFLTAPAEMVQSSPTTKRSPRVFVKVQGEITELHLVVYRAHNSVMCFLLETPCLTAEYCGKMHAFVGPQLGNLSTIITEQVSKRTLMVSDQQYRYVYYNSMNMAIRSSIHLKRSNQLVSGVAVEIMKLLVDIHKDIDVSNSNEGSGCEIVTKTMNDCWVVGKQSGFRQFFVVLNQKNATIVEICEEVQHLVNTSFGNILFLD